MAVAYPQLVASSLPGFPVDHSIQLVHILYPFYNELLNATSNATLASTSQLEQNQFAPKKEVCESTGSSPSPPLESEGRNSSSPESGAMRVKRGRPQQDIQDNDDPTSQKRKHRRLYARQYRAQMRQRVDEVKSLKSEAEELKRLLREQEAESRRLREELAQKNFFINNLQCVLQSRVM